jgi:uncharacterized membrane protein YedE/YeeE
MAENMLIGLGLVGGILIGLGSAVMLYFNGKIAGISGILGGVLGKWDENALWRYGFLVGIPVGVLLVTLLRGAPDIQITASTPVLVIAGLLVGFGTRLGSGCTSGHGVCGLARLSPRSLAATGIFMVTAALTVFVARHVLGG